MRTWSSYRANRIAQVIGFGGVAISFAPRGLSGDVSVAFDAWINRHVPLSASIFLVLMFLMIVPTLNLINWRCPRCGERFSYPARDRSACQHCGLAKFGDPSSERA